jgi:hypothetical protein
MCTIVPGAVVPEFTLSSITKKIGEPYGKTERGEAGVAETVGTGRGKPCGAAGGGKARAAGVTAHASAAVATAAETIAWVRFMSPSAVGGFRFSRGGCCGSFLAFLDQLFDLLAALLTDLLVECGTVSVACGFAALLATLFSDFLVEFRPVCELRRLAALAAGHTYV